MVNLFPLTNFLRTRTRKMVEIFTADNAGKNDVFNPRPNSHSKEGSKPKRNVALATRSKIFVIILSTNLL